MTPFDLFVGIDWSGERGTRLRRLQVAICAPGDGAPTLVANPRGGPWSRPDVVGWLLARFSAARVLCGLDFSFCFPWQDHEAYFPGFADDPADYAAFWDLVEAMCFDDECLFGGALADVEPFADHFRRGIMTGAAYSRRLRETERRAQAGGRGTPESVFNMVGARQVGKASLSGMRALRGLKSQDGVAIWPFEAPGTARLVAVEAFPTAFVRLAGEGPGKVRDIPRLDRVLAHYGSRGVAQAWGSGHPGLTDDMTDALMTAAALRALAPDPAMWNPPGLSDSVRRSEGWTFGIL
jgi:hypothetical protein